MENFIQRSCSSFTEALASKAAVPGGGGTAAFVGALGVALCSMVGNFTIGKKKYAAVEDEIKEMQVKAENLRLRLLELVDEDAKTFAPLAKAYAIPKDDPTREEVLKISTLNACKVPVEIVERCSESIDLINEMLEKGSKMLISDIGCGALLCRAAMESAAMNVYINTNSLKNCTEANLICDKVDSFLSDYLPKVDEIVCSVMRQIR